MSAPAVASTPHIPVPGSQDLSGSTRKQLELIIQEEGGKVSRYTLPPFADGLSFADALRTAMQTKREKTLPKWDPTECPCTVVSFYPDTNELTVKMLPMPPAPPIPPPNP